MASGYALPTASTPSTFQQHGHGHSHSYSGSHLAPSRTPQQNGYAKSNGHVRKAPSAGSLYTLGEVSRETSPNEPAATQQDYRFPPPSFDLNSAAFEHNQMHSSHNYSRSHSHSPMKSNGRARGESDLGRPAEPRSTYRPTLERLDSVPAASTSWFSLPEALTALLIPAPYLFASAAYSSMFDTSATGFPPLSAYNRPAEATILDGSSPTGPTSSAFLETCTLTASTLLLTGILAKLKGSERMTHRRGDSLGLSLHALRKVSAWRTMVLRALSLGLPFYASMLLGGMRTGLILLAAVAASLTCNNAQGGFNLHDLRHGWSSRVATSVVIIISFISDELGLTLQISLSDQMLGYMALVVSLLVLQPPLPFSLPLEHSNSSTNTSTTRRTISGSFKSSTSSPLIQSTGDTHLTLFAGVLASMLTVLFSVILSTAPSISINTMILGTLAMASMSASIFFSQPALLRGQSKVGFALGCFVTASCSFMFSPSLWPGTVCNGGLSALSFLGVLYDTHDASSHSASHHHDHDHDSHAHAGHAHHQHTHQRTHSEAGSSGITKFIMARLEPGSLFHSILSEKDSRRIAYFTTLNFIFMFVQGVYGYLSGSLGLLSDTVHMFFDCLGLIVGLGATVASKWPTSPEKPYGWGKLNTLAGFGNGVFLMLVSVEFVWEAVEGILEQRKLRHVTELLVVSTAGFLVNMVGLFAFGHAHAGHDHGHSHSHSHGQSPGKAHSHAHDHHAHEHHAHDHHEHDHHEHDHTEHDHHGHNHDHKANGHAHGHELVHSHSHGPHDQHHHDHAVSHASHDHGHHEHNDNMHGIFLHVAADAGGSLAVILSTALNLWKPWYVWDPAATIIIAILIFAAAVPLVVSSGQKLLLVIPDELEYSLKNILQELGELRGVIGYANPRFWIDDKEDAGDAHGHHHGHDHGGGGVGKSKKVMGVIHIIASPIADIEDVRARVEDFLLERNMDVVIDVEHERAHSIP